MRKNISRGCADVYGEIKPYAVIIVLDKTVLNRLINQMLIGGLEKVDGGNTQEVRLVYNFDGEL